MSDGRYKNCFINVQKRSVQHSYNCLNGTIVNFCCVKASSLLITFNRTKKMHNVYSTRNCIISARLPLIWNPCSKAFYLQEPKFTDLSYIEAQLLVSFSKSSVIEN
jgi:hypothetical protein